MTAPDHRGSGVSESAQQFAESIRHAIIYLIAETRRRGFLQTSASLEEADRSLEADIASPMDEQSEHGDAKESPLGGDVNPRGRAAND